MDVNFLSKSDLMAICRARNLPTNGNKQKLIKAITNKLDNNSCSDSKENLDLSTVSNTDNDITLISGNKCADYSTADGIIKIVNVIMDKFNNKLDKLIDIIQHDIFDLQKSNDKIMTEMDGIKKENVMLKSQIKCLSADVDRSSYQLDEMEQRQNDNLMQLIGGPNDVSAQAIISQVADAAGEKINDIQLVNESTTRAGMKKLTININKKIKINIFKKKKILKNDNIKVYEVLTKKRFELLIEARKLCQLNLIKSAYSYNGTIMIKVAEGNDPVKIYSLMALTALTQKSS